MRMYLGLSLCATLTPAFKSPKGHSIGTQVAMGMVSPEFGAELGIQYGQWRDSGMIRKSWTVGLNLQSAQSLFLFDKELNCLDAFGVEGKMQRGLLWSYVGLSADLGLGLGIAHRVKERCIRNCSFLDTGEIYEKVKDDWGPNMYLSASTALTLFPKSVVSVDLGARVLSYPGFVLFSAVRGNW